MNGDEETEVALEDAEESETGGTRPVRNIAPAIPLAIALVGGTVLPTSESVSTIATTSVGVPREVADSPFAVHFLDVGTGDSAIIDIGEQEIVIDGGDSIRVLNDYAARTGIIDGPIELVVVTHGDFDHWNGLRRLLGFDGRNTNPPGVLEFWEPGYDRDCRRLESYETFLDDVQDLDSLMTFRRPLENTHLPGVETDALDLIQVPGLPDVQLTLLHSDSDPPASNGDCAYRINNASIVLMAEIFNHRFLFTGDANGKEREEDSPGTPGHIEAPLLALDSSIGGVLKSDVLKVPHHGSESASTQAFINAVDPDFVVISASTKHHLPRGTVVDRYDDGDRVILRTDDDRTNDNNHIICYQTNLGELNCNHETVLNEV